MTTDKDHEGSASTPAPQSFPQRIRFSEHAESYLQGIADALVTGDVNVHQLPRSLFDIFYLGLYEGEEIGEEKMRESMNRLYSEMCSRLPGRDYSKVTPVTPMEFDKNASGPSRTYYKKSA